MILMHVVSTIMVAVGLGLILIGVIGLTLSWVCEAGEETEMGATSSVTADAVPPSPKGEGFEETMKEEEHDAV